jgi:hypothetical protein
MYMYANRFHQPMPGDGGKHIHLSPSTGCASGTNCTATQGIYQIYQNSFGGGGWAIDIGGMGEGQRNFPHLHMRNNVFSSRGLSSGGFNQIGSNTGNLTTTIWRTNAVPDFVLPTSMRNGATSLISTGLPGMTSGYYEDGAPDHGAIQGDLETPPEPPPTITPGLALELTHNCGSASNSLNASVLGSLFYLLPGQIYDATALVRASCASNVTMTDVASVLQSGFPAVMPFHFDAVGVSPSGNSCSNCLSVHNGTATSNEGGAGWTVSGLLEGTTVTAATGGDNPYLELPGLCKRYIDGELTNDPLWPWPMNQRIIDARTAAGKPPTHVTNVVETLFGPLPVECTTTTPLPLPPAPQTSWYIATDGVDGEDCTLAEPCGTIAHVAGRMGAGHTLYLRGGTYTQKIDSGIAAIPGGTSWDTATVITAYEQEQVILQLPTTVLAWFRNPATDHYIIVNRLILDGESPPSVQTNGFVFVEGTHHIRVQNSVSRNMRFEHVLVAGGDQIEILNNTFDDNGPFETVRLLGVVDGLRFEGNVIDGSEGGGMVVADAQVTHTTITRNTFRNLALTGILLQQGADALLISNNLFYGNLGCVTVSANVVGTKIYNNTCADNTGTGIQIDVGAIDTLLTNNIVYGNETEISDSGTDTVLTTNVTTDPGFVGSGNYRIAAGDSPAVDEGTDLAEVTVTIDNLPRTAGQYDIGAYDRASSAPVSPPGALSATPVGAGMMFLAE